MKPMVQEIKISLINAEETAMKLKSIDSDAHLVFYVKYDTRNYSMYFTYIL